MILVWNAVWNLKELPYVLTYSKKRKSKKYKGYVLVLLLCFVLIVYTIHDNNRIIIIQETIPINNLPEEFEGFTILQITDLHERRFGDNQEKLLEAINSVNYDAIVFTGDLLDDPKSTNYEPVYTLLEGISNKEMAFFVPGNTDPESYIIGPDYPEVKDDFVNGMEERGVQLLESVQKVEREEAALYFTYFENSIKIENKKGRNKIKNFAHQQRLHSKLSTLDTLTESDTLIALNHYPIPDAKIDDLKNDEEFVFRNYDLIIAGHYHGGQIRLPFVGALFVPEPYYLGDGLFPPRNRIKGLWDYQGIQQYVSTGLGSSDAISFLKFRFLNPPEMNVLTLTGK